MKRRNEMAHISVILAELLSGLGMVEPEAEAAVNAPRPGPRNNRDETVVRYEFETPDQTSREATVDRAPAQDEPAHLLDSVRGLTPRAMGDEGKGAEAVEASAQVAQGVRQTTGKRGGSASVASLPVGKSMVAVTRRKQRQPHASAAIIDLLMWKRDHTRSLSRTG